MPNALRRAIRTWCLRSKNDVQPQNVTGNRCRFMSYDIFFAVFGEIIKDHDIQNTKTDSKDGRHRSNHYFMIFRNYHLFQESASVFDFLGIVMYCDVRYSKLYEIIFGLKIVRYFRTQRFPSSKKRKPKKKRFDDEFCPRE